MKYDMLERIWRANIRRTMQSRRPVIKSEVANLVPAVFRSSFITAFATSNYREI